MAAEFSLHRLGWQSFQDLCVAVAEECLKRPVQTFLPTNDAGRDGAFTGKWTDGADAGESTIQCKFTSDPNLKLTVSLLNDELPKAKRLAEQGLAQDYIILTNHPVTGRSELEIRRAFESRGVGRCRVFHRDWITRQINASPKLRMMVPRLYGLADLGGILGDDLRAYKQAQLILTEMGDSLRKFVVTDAHRRSVDAINEFGTVLLLGEPAAGKSTIGASLALAAADSWQCSVVKATSPDTLEPRIDPEARQFFWIDDAFGSTQFQRDRVERWNQVFPLMQAALRSGSKFLITSRDYIWHPASKELKISAFPALKNSKVIIYTQSLSVHEKARILYNHVKLGDQPNPVKAALRPLLGDMAIRKTFLPETARRLGNPLFTGNLRISLEDVGSFFDKPKDFLEQTISSLSPEGKAAIAVLFLNGGMVRSPVPADLLERPASDFGATTAKVREQLKAFDGSLLLQAEDEDGPYWTYRHPTISDAFGTYVGKEPELVEIYLHGAKSESIVREVVCAGTKLRGAMLTVPKSLESVLIDRLLTLPRTTLTTFISYRANKRVAETLLAERTDLWKTFDFEFSIPIKEDRDVDFLVALHKFGLLPEELRIDFFEQIQSALRQDADSSFLDSEKIASVLNLEEVQKLLLIVEQEVISSVPQYITKMKDRWESDYNPDEYFDPLFDAIDTFAKAVGHDPRQIMSQNASFLERALDDLRYQYYDPPSSYNDSQSARFADSSLNDLFRDVAD